MYSKCSSLMAANINILVFPDYAADDMLLLHASSVSNKISMKLSPDLQRDPVNLVNCEHSFGTIRHLPCLKCRYESLIMSLSTLSVEWCGKGITHIISVTVP